MKKITQALAVGILAIGLSAISVRAIDTTATLADLSSGAVTSIGIGDKIFSDFDFQAVNLTSFDASQIIVTASSVGQNYYLTWSGSIALTSVGPAVADLLLYYSVTATAGQIFMIDQSYVGSAQPPGGSFIAVDEVVRTGGFGGSIVANSHLEVGDLQDPFAEIGDSLFVNPPQSILYVTKDIALGIASPTGGFVTLSEVQQSFHQTSVPDGGLTLALLGISLAGVEGLRRRFKA